MHGNRRRKKRSSYGVRTVDITKGPNGFGFTISGQVPCILSCIVPSSPADQAGLRQGDYLIAVNGQNVSKVPHDDVVRLVGRSKLLKLQIADKYYSDSSDDEFTVNRPKPKYPNRLRHKHQQTRTEKVGRDIQNGAKYSEHSTSFHNAENAPLSDRDWTDSFPSGDPYIPTSPSSVPTTMTSAGIAHNPSSKTSTSPTRLRPDQIRLVMAEARQVPRSSRTVRNEAPIHPLRARKQLSREKLLKSKPSGHQQQDLQPATSRESQLLPMRQPLQTKTNFQHHHLHNGRQHVHNTQMPENRVSKMRQQYQDNLNATLSNHHHPPVRPYQTGVEGNQFMQPSQPQVSAMHLSQHLRQQLNWHRSNAVSPQQELFASHIKQPQYKVTSNNVEPSTNNITEQEINKLLYPTLAELQQSRIFQNDGMENVIYRAVVGYLGTIEMPKDPQGGSRLTAIRNCIRRLRIEKKVHTLVLMSICSEKVVLTNPHGKAIAEYPAERITFCGVYADDKKFFGLVTVHGASSDEISEGSQDESGESTITSASSSCHVFMVDPNTIHHPDHCRRAKNFRLDCTTVANQDTNSSTCMEFPDTADPILHSIMSLYRNRVGFQLENGGAPGLIDVDAQMSPPHSNTSSNSSNSDSGIGFRDEGGHHNYHNSERVFVVEIDENQRARTQNGHASNMSAVENVRANTIGTTKSLNKNGNFAGARKIGSLDPFASTSVAHCSDTNKNTNSTDRSKIREAQRVAFLKMEGLCANEMENEEEAMEESKSSLERKNDGRKSKLDGRISVTEELRTVFQGNNFEDSFPMELLPNALRDCTSPHDGNRLTVRAMPDPVSFERSPGHFVNSESPVQVASIRHSMHKYLQHKQEHLVKVSQKINRRESDSVVAHPLSARAFSPPTGKQTPTASLNKPQASIDLILKLSPQVFADPFRPSAPSEHSFTRSLEDLRDSSTSDGMGGPIMMMIKPPGPNFRDGSESDHGLTRLLHASETNLVRCGPIGVYPDHGTRGAFRAVHPRPNSVSILPPLSRLSDVKVMSSVSCLGSNDTVNRPMDSADDNTETTENTGGREGSQTVHPPTQDEFSHDSDSEVVDGRDDKKQRALSLRRLSRSRLATDRTDSNSNASQSESEIRRTRPLITVNNGNNISQVESRVGSWATSFEKMVEDPAGLHTFAEFLKKEYSHENIYFWTACQRYKMVEEDEERQQMAQTIFNKHLGVGASEPVNVDSQARQVAQEGLQNPDEFLFAAAQKQIFNLMKFDSYSRFLKSDLYNKCLHQDRKGLPLPYIGDDPDLEIVDNTFSNNLKKSKSDAEERRRKSLLPWHRKDRSKSKDRGETEYLGRRKSKLGHRTTSESSSSAKSQMTDSHTSLNSADFTQGTRAVSRESLTSGDAVSLRDGESCSLCRFSLPDSSNSVMALRSGETVKDVVRLLLDRRRINFTAFNVIQIKGDKLIDPNKDCLVLSGLEVKIEQMVLFSLHLRNRKTVYVKAKPTKLIHEVLKPILNKYGLKLDLMVINKAGDNKGINLKGPITDLDGEKLIIQTKEEIKEWCEPGRHSKRSNLDEITNRVFEDLLNGKTQSSFDDLGVLDFDSRSTKTDPTSETSSSLLDSFSRRESLSLERNSSKPGGMLYNPSVKRRGQKPNNISTKQENELYEGLKRAQMSRIDDQRGTEINFELPDFLKSDQNQDGDFLSRFERSFHSTSSEGMEQEEFMSHAHPEVWGDIQTPPTSSADVTLLGPQDLDLDDLEETMRNPSDDMLQIIKNETPCKKKEDHRRTPTLITAAPRSRLASPFITPPPPLPPKPKLGGALRGPPPRPPPSKQLTSLYSLHLLEPAMRQNDKFSVSFV